MKNYDSLVEALSDAKNRRYKKDFEIQPTCFFCRILDLRMEPELFIIDEVYRLEENSDPENNCVLYLISCISGVKGSIVDAYGIYAEDISFDMARKLRIHI